MNNFVTASIVGLRYYNSSFLVAGSWTRSYHVSIRCVTKKKKLDYFQKLMNPNKKIQCSFDIVLHTTYYKIQEVCKTCV